jgi:hypothetical protein
MSPFPSGSRLPNQIPYTATWSTAVAHQKLGFDRLESRRVLASDGFESWAMECSPVEPAAVIDPPAANIAVVQEPVQTIEGIWTDCIFWCVPPGEKVTPPISQAPAPGRRGSLIDVQYGSSITHTYEGILDDGSVVRWSISLPVFINPPGDRPRDDSSEKCPDDGPAVNWIWTPFESAPGNTIPDHASDSINPADASDEITAALAAAGVLVIGEERDENEEPPHEVEPEPIEESPSLELTDDLWDPAWSIAEEVMTEPESVGSDNEQSHELQDEGGEGLIAEWEQDLG